MKIFSGAVLAIACVPSSVAFVANTQKSVQTQLNVKADGNIMVGPALAGLAGLTLASQVAGAAPLDQAVSPQIDATPIIVQEEMSMTKIETSPVSAISGSSLQLADEYLDFSMPSYGESSSSSAKPKASESAPAFSNPFGDFSFSAPDNSAAEEKAAESKAAKKQAAAESKAAKEQAAADKKAAEEEAAARKKAEKEARREAEKEKQRLAVERANQIKEEKAAAAAEAAATATSYELPEVKVPEFKAPEVKVPEFKAPDIKVPEFKAPDFGSFKAPETSSVDIPEFKAPDIKVPEVSLPKFSMPKAPEMPKFDTPSVSTPSFSAPSTSFEAPKTPKFSAPSIPAISAPSFSSSSSSGGYASLDEDIIDDQEERDAAAKEARSVFNTADANAKEVENEARRLRAIADDKKKIAKEAKDAACATRFGGKFLCIRPFGIGY